MPIYSQDDTDSITFDISDLLRGLIETAIEAAIDNLNQSKKVTPAVFTRSPQGEVKITPIENSDQNDVERKAMLLIRPNSNDIDQYVTIYNALVQHQDSLRIKPMLILLAGEKGQEIAYRIGQPYPRKWFRPIQKPEKLFLMGSAEQFLVGE